MAYRSNESDRFEIDVQALPSGREPFYRNGDEMLVVDVDTLELSPRAGRAPVAEIASPVAPGRLR